MTIGLAAGGRAGGVAAINMIYLSMLFALALDKLVFGQSPGWWSLGGSGLILGSAVFVAVQKNELGDGERRWGDEEVGLTDGVGGTEEEMGMLSVERRDDEVEMEVHAETETENVR